MTKLLHYSFLLVFIFLSNLGFSQSSTPTFQIAHQHTNEQVSIKTHLDADNIIVLLANLPLDAEVMTDHCNDVSLIDIISSEKEEDLNCLGGFCMDHTHFHKRGLNIKSRRQLFRYFVKISC